MLSMDVANKRRLVLHVLSLELNLVGKIFHVGVSDL